MRDYTPSLSREEEWHAIQERLRQVLALHGRNGLEDTYRLAEEDFKAYEQKTLVFYRDVVTTALLEALQDLLWDYSRQWHVSILVANNDGTEVTPPTGIRVSALNLEGLPPIEISVDEDRDTRKLYASLEELLGAQGKNNAFGDGDYWIVDDSWVPRFHKVCIFKIEFLTPHLASEVQPHLKDKFLTCQVWFEIEVAEPGIPIPLPGTRIFADRIEQDWNRLEMAPKTNVTSWTYDVQGQLMKAVARHQHRHLRR